VGQLFALAHDRCRWSITGRRSRILTRVTAAFEGIRVIDATSGIAGALAIMFLADFGAEVIRIEPAGGGPLAKLPGAYCWNRNKLRVDADLESLEGRETARRLLATADVAAFDCGPHDLGRLGFTVSDVRRLNPAILHAWLPPYGLSDPWANLPASDGLLSALTGISQLQATSPGRPVRLVTPQATYAHGILGALAIASAVFERSRMGVSRAITVSGLHAVSAIEGGGLVKSGGSSQMFERGTAPNYRLYECGDGEWLFFGALTLPFFSNALEVMDASGLMADPAIGGDFANVLQAPGSASAVSYLEARFRERPCPEWERLLLDAGVPVARVGSREEWFRGETVAAHDMRVVLPHSVLGPIELPGVALELSETPGSVRHLLRKAPAGVFDRQPRSVAFSGVPPNGGPLAGIRVLDLGGFVAGPFGPTLLAAFGADVIKVESPGGDPFRTYGLTFVAHNRGKRGAVIDLKEPAGLAAFESLVRIADVVVDNFRPGVRERLGIADGRLQDLNPSLVVCSVTGYGARGPFGTDPGFDPLVQAQGGLMRAQGGDGPPVFHQIAVNDTAAAISIAFGAVAALVARQRTGRGQFVRTNLAVQAMLCQSGELTSYKGAPPAPVGGGDFAGPRALDRLYRCSDGWLAISCGNVEHAAALASVLFGNDAVEAAALLAESGDGPAARRLEAAFATCSRLGIVEALLAAGVPCAPAFTLDEVIADPSLGADGFLDEFDYAEIGRITGVARFADWEGVPRQPRPTAPTLGEHTAEVLAEAGLAGVTRF
jgi:crotonobetainyl-CoA:carnitine CoA-transferase CaiB-like acyl-CoA transferase